MNRREYVGWTGAVCAGAALAGCSSLGDADTPGERRRIIDGREHLPAGESSRFSFRLQGRADLEFEFSVLDGPDVEVLVFDDERLEQYEPGNRSMPVAYASGPNGHDVTTLEAATYHLIVENADIGVETPPGTAEDATAVVELDAWLDPG